MQRLMDPAMSSDVLPLLQMMLLPLTTLTQHLYEEWEDEV